MDGATQLTGDDSSLHLRLSGSLIPQKSECFAVAQQLCSNFTEVKLYVKESRGFPSYESADRSDSTEMN